MSSAVFTAGVVLLLAVYVNQIRVSQAAATPKSLREIFIGRCNEYQEVVNPKLFVNNPKDCTELWNLFYEAFANRDGCSVPIERYDNFTNAADHDIDTNNRVMYWSGSVYPFVYEYTAEGRRYVTIRDVLSGYLIKNIDAWCGQTDSPGYNTTQCPGWGACWNTQATPTYWQSISRKFAKRVQGTIYVLLNASSGSAFRNLSTFAQYELTNLEACRTPELSVILMHNIRGEPNSKRESCVNGTLVDLKRQVESKNMRFSCTEDPPDITYFQCVDDLGAEPCTKMAAVAAGATNPSVDSSLASFPVTSLIAVAITGFSHRCYV